MCRCVSECPNSKKNSLKGTLCACKSAYELDGLPFDYVNTGSRCYCNTRASNPAVALLDPNAKEEELECAICLESAFERVFESKDRGAAVMTRCGHHFHKNCLDGCLEAPGSRCPLCVNNPKPYTKVKWLGDVGDKAAVTSTTAENPAFFLVFPDTDNPAFFLSSSPTEPPLKKCRVSKFYPRRCKGDTATKGSNICGDCYQNFCANCGDPVFIGKQNGYSGLHAYCGGRSCPKARVPCQFYNPSKKSGCRNGEDCPWPHSLSRA